MQVCVYTTIQRLRRGITLAQGHSMAGPDHKISASEFVYVALREKIITLELAPNSTAGEQFVADLLGVSRTPVREAIGRLESEGLIETDLRNRVIVAPIRPDAVRTAQFIRETLEVAIVREAAAVGPRGDLFSVLQSIEEQQWAADQGDINRFYRADEAMHLRVCRIAGREQVWRLIDDAKVHMDRLRRLDLLKPETLRELIDDHRKIVTAIRQGDCDQAEEALRVHVRRALGRLPDLMNRSPEFFAADQASGLTTAKAGRSQ